MRTKGTLPLLVALFFLILLATVPVARATLYGPYDDYWYYSVEGYSTANADQMYPGGTVYLDYCFVNTMTSGSITYTQIELTTPWQTYTDTSLPVTVDQGYEYCSYFTITIPSSEQTGAVTWSFTNSAINFPTYTDSIDVTIFANPATLESQISSLTTQVTSLQSEVSSLQSQLTAAQGNATSLRNTVASLKNNITSYQSEVSSLQTQLTTAKNNATSLQQSVVSVKSQLSASQSQLSTTQTQLSNATAKVNTLTTQLQSDQSAISNKTAQISTLTSQLSTAKASLATANTNLAFSQGEVATYSSFYLPVGVVVPSIVAVLFLVMYLRKGPRLAAPAARMSAPQTATAMASPAAAVSGSKFCPDCGTENKAIAKFCAKCGASLS